MRTFFLIIKKFFAVECSRGLRIKNTIMLSLTVLILTAVTALGYTLALVNSHNIMYDSALTYADIWN
jgi:hypothetical protein